MSCKSDPGTTHYAGCDCHEESHRLEVAEWEAKYNFMVGSAQLNAKERDAAEAKIGPDRRYDLHDLFLAVCEERDRLQAVLESLEAGAGLDACLCKGMAERALKWLESKTLPSPHP